MKHRNNSDVFVEGNKTTRIKKKKRHPIRTILILFFLFCLIASANDSNEESAVTTSPTVSVTATATSISTATSPTLPTTIPTEAPTTTPTATPTSTPTPTPAITPTNTPFTVEHDEAYYATQDYIYNFLTEKGYEVQTIIGIPNIGRYEDTDTSDNYVNWYAYVMHKGKWTEFVVLLFNGEVSYIRPNE